MWVAADTSVLASNPYFFADGSITWWSAGTGLTAFSITSNSASLAWAAGVNPAITGYMITLNGGAPFSVGNVTSTTLSGLSPGTTYLVQIAAYDAYGDVSSFLPATPVSFTTLGSSVGAIMSNTNTVPQALFGPGVAICTPTSGSDLTPFNIGFVNELSLDYGFDTKQLKGQFQFPLLVARGTAKTSGKMKAATASGRALNTFIYGGTWTVGTQYGLSTTAATPIPTTPFQITPVAPASGTFNQDLGVVNAATGEPLQLITTGTPAAGQYKVAAGVYTFSSADNVSGISVKISFAYTWTTGSAGQNLIIQNQLIGTTPTFQLDYSTILYGAEYYVRLFACVASKSAINHKIDDFAMPEYDFEFFANAAQQIGIVSLATTA